MREHEHDQIPEKKERLREGDLRFVRDYADGGAIQIWRRGGWTQALIALDGEAPLAEWLVDADRRAREGPSEPAAGVGKPRSRRTPREARDASFPTPVPLEADESREGAGDNHPALDDAHQG